MRGEHRLCLDRQIGPPFEAQHLGDLQPREVLEAAQHKRLVDAPCDLFIAKMLRIKVQIKRLNRLPELFVIHRLKPLYDIISIFKIMHGINVSNRAFPAQILSGKRG